MKTKEISLKEFEDFAKKQDLNNFYQSKEWQELKLKLSTDSFFFGCYKDKKLCAAGLLIIFPFLKLFKYVYCPRGFLVNFNNLNLIEEVTISIKKFLKDKKYIFLRIDPAVALNRIQTNGDIIEDNNGHKILKKLKELDYQHYGYNVGFETFQARFNHVIYLENSYEETFGNFSKSTRKNIETSLKKGVVVKEGTIEELRQAYELFEKTADRKNFHSYSFDFYKKMMDCYKKGVTLYMAYIDPNEYQKNYEILLKNEQNNLDIIHKKMEHDNIGKKLLQQEEISKNLIEKYISELKNIDKMEDKLILIASLLSIDSGNEYISFISGMKNEYRNFYPKYAMYNQHIKDAVQRKKKVVNFFGVKGIFDKNDKDYGIYEIKKGFGGETLEYIGQFDLVINKFLYKLGKRG